MKKDLICVHLYNDYSGSPRVLRDAIQLLNESYDELCLYTSQHEGFLSGAEGARKNIFYARSEHKLIQLIIFLFSQFLTFFYLSFDLIGRRMQGIDTTVLVNTLLPFGAGLAAKLFSNKVIYYIHESRINPYPLYLFLRAIANQCSDKVLFVSSYVKGEVNLNKPVQEVVYNGLRSDFSPAIELNWENKHAGRTVLFAGSLKEYKGIEQFVQLAELLPGFKFVAALNCTDEEFQKFVSKHKLSENLVFLHRPQNICQLFTDGFCVVNMSLPERFVETFGLSLLEGMSCGCPVIAPPKGGPIEFVTAECGLIIDARDLGTISSFLQRLAADYELWMQYAVSAQQESLKFSAASYRSALLASFSTD